MMVAPMCKKEVRSCLARMSLLHAPAGVHVAIRWDGSACHSEQGASSHPCSPVGFPVGSPQGGSSEQQGSPMSSRVHLQSCKSGGTDPRWGQISRVRDGHDIS